jgi:hypothetical protein
MLYGFVLDQRERDPALARAVHLVRYEDLCDRPEATLGTVFAHAELPLAPDELAPMAARLSQPTYYDPGFTPAEEAVIAEETRAVRTRLGYG